MISLAFVGISASTEFGGKEAGVAVVVGVAVVAEAVSLSEGATAASDVLSNTLVVSVNVESGGSDAAVGVGDESVTTVGVLELSILWVESVINNAVVLLTGVTVTVVVVAETGRIINVVLALSLVGRLVVGVGGVLTLVDIIDDLVVLLTVVESLVAGVLGAGIIDVVSALDVVTLVATVLIGTLVVESSEIFTSLEAKVEATFVAEAGEAAKALEAGESAETVFVSLAAPALGLAPAALAPTGFGAPVVDVLVTIAVIAISGLDTVAISTVVINLGRSELSVVVLSGTNVGVVVTVSSGLTAEVEAVEVAGLVLATGALAVAVVNGLGVAATSSKAVIKAGDALVVDVVVLGVSASLDVAVVLVQFRITRVTADSGTLAESADAASARGRDGAVDVLSSESAVATAETFSTTLTGVGTDSGTAAECTGGASASLGLGAEDVVATIGLDTVNLATVATVGLLSPGGGSNTSESAESERLEHFVCKIMIMLFKASLLNDFANCLNVIPSIINVPNSTDFLFNLQNVVRILKNIIKIIINPYS